MRERDEVGKGEGEGGCSYMARSRSVGGTRNVSSQNVLNLQGDRVPDCVKRHVIKYRIDEKDVNWASEGVVAMVCNGESIPLLQQHIVDVGFDNLDIIPMGADGVLLKSSGGGNVNLILSDATYFFNSFFTSIASWNCNNVKFERGDWVRLYGIPLQAWNETFFKLCDFDHGRLMRVDSCTVDRERLDFSRILLATSSLNIINDTVDIFVDDFLVNINIVEE